VKEISREIPRETTLDPDIDGMQRFPSIMIGTTRGNTRKIVWGAILFLALIFGIPLITAIL
jgi:hypothetical protein